MATTGNADGTSADGTNAGGMAGAGGTAARLAAMADRTSLMAIDATLRALPGDGTPALAFPTAISAADEVRDLARRMLQATRDFRAAIHEPAE